MKQLVPNYPYSSISTSEALAKHLGVSLSDLQDLVIQKNSFYKPGKKFRKKDGSIRETHDALPPLKQLHELIKNKLLKRVIYPDYIQGGIADPKRSRSYITHSKKHANKRVVI